MLQRPFARSTFRSIGLCLGPVLCLALCLGCEQRETAAQSAMSPQARIERGRYIADHVAMCTDCHTPRDETGQLVRSKWLQGAPIDFQPKNPMPHWGEFAPPLAGLAVYPREHVVTLLSTGKRADGTACLPPMPPYTMSTEDAEAVAAYLASLKP